MSKLIQVIIIIVTIGLFVTLSTARVRICSTAICEETRCPAFLPPEQCEQAGGHFMLHGGYCGCCPICLSLDKKW